MGEFSVAHWAVVLVVAMLLFGYQKLPDAARSIGRSMRVFKSEVRGMRSDDAAELGSERTPAVPATDSRPIDSGAVGRGRITAAAPWEGPKSGSGR